LTRTAARSARAALVAGCRRRRRTGEDRRKPWARLAAAGNTSPTTRCGCTRQVTA